MNASTQYHRSHTHRRGVASVLSMMFLVIFGSLAAAMAVVASGNIRTATASLQVSRATSAAETGLVYAAWTLKREAARFVVKKGEIEAEYAGELWNGNWNSSVTGAVEILPPSGYTVNSPPSGLAMAIRDAHLAADHSAIIESGDSALPNIENETGALVVRPIQMGNETGAPYFKLRYEPIPGEAAVRVISEGVDRDVRRSLTMDFRIDKRIEYAVVTPNRLMIGKNVMVSGPLGTRYGENPGELNGGNGDPLTMRSDFYYLSPTLDQKLDAFYAIVQTDDVDDDARLRPGHGTEGQQLSSGGFEDLDGDEFIDDFDLFLSEFDGDGDGQIFYDNELSDSAGLGSGNLEFAGIDDQLAHLMDNFMPDRNQDGIIDDDDTRLGYRDGVLSSWDRYAKVTGRLAFAVSRDEWEAEHGAPIRSIVQGPERSGIGESAMMFEVDEETLRVVTTEMFSDSAEYYQGIVSSGDGLLAQSEANVNSNVDAEFIAAENAGWEETPLGSQNAYDWYQRPVYRNMVFRDVLIPVGTNALFDNCTFVGVTYIETDSECQDVNWNYAGALEREDLGDGNYSYASRFGELFTQHPTYGEVTDSKAYSNNLRFNGCTFLGSIAGDTPGEYTHWRNKIQLTGASRFFVDPEDPDLALQPDGEELQDELETIPSEQLETMARSSVMMPGWSVDVGSFTNETTSNLDESPRIDLRGVIVAGILDIRGTAEVKGTLLMTFRAVPGQGPLYYDGQTDAFNTTIGYFGALDGDGEGADPNSPEFDGFGEITLMYDPDVALPDGIPWPILAEAIPASYREGSQ